MKTLQDVAVATVTNKFPLKYKYDIGTFTLMAMKVAETYAQTHSDQMFSGEKKTAIVRDHIESVIRVAIAKEVCTEDDGYKAIRILGGMGEVLEDFVRAICLASKNPSYIQTEHIEAATKCIMGCLERKKKIKK